MHITQLITLGTGLLSASIVTAQQASGTTGGNGTATSGSGPQVQLTSANDFCLFLPPQPGLEIAVNEDNGIPFCMNTTSIPGSQPFPQGFITTAHYQQTPSYTQITGFMDSSKYNLSPNDGGGQYDSHANHKPTGGSCQNFPYFVSMIEPSDNRFCIRCCQNTEDCKTGISQYGCLRVVTPGNYDNNNAFDDIPPSAANESGSASSSSSAIAPTDSASSNTSGTSTDSSSTSSSSTVSGDNQMASQEHPNTSYDSVLNELDTATASNQNNTDATTSGNHVPNNSSDVKSVEDEAKYIQSQLQNPQVDLNTLKAQFSTFASDLSRKFPEASEKIKQLETIVSSYQTTEQWQHLATVLQQKTPGASDASSSSTSTVPTGVASGPVSGN